MKKRVELDALRHCFVLSAAITTGVGVAISAAMHESSIIAIFGGVYGLSFAGCATAYLNQGYRQYVSTEQLIERVQEARRKIGHHPKARHFDTYKR